MVRALRLSVTAWQLGKRLGIDLVGATEGPALTTDVERAATFDELIAAARAEDGIIDAASCPYPVHELLTHMVVKHDLLLHGSNNPALEVLEPRPARDLATELHAVVACDDAIWPMFYAVVARDRVDGVFSACMHLGRPPRLRRFYLFALFDADPAAPSSWTAGALYALPRDGFRREWGREWVNAGPVRPVLRVLVEPDDFPLREVVVAAEIAEGIRGLGRRLRAAGRRRAPAGRGSSSCL
jgi:hypothetical protein